MDRKRMLVIGAGPAGLSCALHLLRAGHEVTVLEKERRALDKVCGEGVLPFGVDLLRELGVLGAVQADAMVFRGICYKHEERAVQCDFRNGRYGLGVDRRLLDQVLRAACEGFPQFSQHTGRRFQDEDLGAYDQIFAADGIHAGFAHRMGVTSKPGKRLGLRLRLPVKPPEQVTIHFFKNYEIYFTPTDREVLSVAFLVEPGRRRGAELKQFCLDALAQHFPEYADLEPLDLKTRAPIAARRRGPNPDAHLLGDAHRAFDPITGAGMSWALLCGKLAAQHHHSPTAYYAALAKHERAIGSYTALALFFRGGGLRTRLMMRQLQGAPRAFANIIDRHDGISNPYALDIRSLCGLLRPF